MDAQRTLGRKPSTLDRTIHRCWAFFLLILSKVSFSDPGEKKIFIMIG